MHASSFHNTHSCLPLYVTITCTRLKHEFHFIVVLIAKCTGKWYCESFPKDELPDPRWFVANNIPSHAIEQANQEVRQDDYHSQQESNQASNA